MCVCVTWVSPAASKVPILIFSGSFSGEMVKWEQLQLNLFLYRYTQCVTVCVINMYIPLMCMYYYFIHRDMGHLWCVYTFTFLVSFSHSCSEPCLDLCVFEYLNLPLYPFLLPTQSGYLELQGGTVEGNSLRGRWPASLILSRLCLQGRQGWGWD